MFCKYRDSLGKVNEGVHSYRLFGLAIVDVVFTIIGAYVLYLFICRVLKMHNMHLGYKWFWAILVGVFLTGILLHRLFCVRTTIDKLLFG